MLRMTADGRLRACLVSTDDGDASFCRYHLMLYALANHFGSCHSFCQRICKLRSPYTILPPDTHHFAHYQRKPTPALHDLRSRYKQPVNSTCRHAYKRGSVTPGGMWALPASIIDGRIDGGDGDGRRMNMVVAFGTGGDTIW